MQVEKHNIFKDASKTHSKSYNTFQLIKSEETKNVYQKQLHKNVMYCMSKYPSQYHRCSKKNNWSHQNNKNHRIHSSVVELLSDQLKELRLRFSSTVNNEKVIELKTQRNRILHDIANILNEDKNGKT